MQFQLNFSSSFLSFSNCNNFVSCCQAHVLSSPRLLHTLRTYLPSCCPLSPSLSLPATTVSSLLPFAAAASLQYVCCCILFIVQCICMSHPRTLAHLAPCVCLHLRLLQFIYCMYICLRPIYTKNTCIYMQRSTNWCCSHCCFNFFVIFYWALAALSIACPSVRGRGSKGLPDCMAISIMHAQIIKLF